MTAGSNLLDFSTSDSGPAPAGLSDEEELRRMGMQFTEGEGLGEQVAAIGLEEQEILELDLDNL